MSTISDYTTFISKQIKSSDYPKVMLESKLPSVTRENYIKKVLNNIVTLTGVLKLNRPLFPNKGTNYYEFLNKPGLDITKWEYYYISVQDFELIESLIPYSLEIDFVKGVYRKVYLNETTFSSYINPGSKKIVTDIYADNFHPILSSFSFSGDIFLLRDKLVYGYYNNNEDFNSALVDYYSAFAPVNNRTSLNINSEISVYEFDPKAVPEVLLIGDKERKLSFTGEMNNTLLKETVLYKYVEIIDNEVYTVFIPHKPFYGAKSLLKDALGIKESFNIRAESTQTVKIKQQSLVNIILNKQ